MKGDEDPILIRQLQMGNHQAFNQIYNKYFLKLFGFSFKLTGSKTDAEEIVQEVFVKVWEKRNELDPEKCLSSFLFTIGKNKIYNRARQRIYSKAYHEHLKHLVNWKEELTDQQISFQETEHFINKAIGLLPAKRKEIFILSKMEGLSNKEIATRLNTSLSNIENHINKALKAIKSHMSENEILSWFFIVHLLQLTQILIGIP